MSRIFRIVIMGLLALTLTAVFADKVLVASAEQGAAEESGETELSITVDSKVFDGVPIEPVITSNRPEDEIVVRYYLVTEEGETLLSGAPKDAGKYRAVASVPGSDQYAEAVDECSFTIEKRHIAISLSAMPDNNQEGMMLKAKLINGIDDLTSTDFRICFDCTFKDDGAYPYPVFFSMIEKVSDYVYESQVILRDAPQGDFVVKASLWYETEGPQNYICDPVEYGYNTDLKNVILTAQDEVKELDAEAFDLQAIVSDDNGHIISDPELTCSVFLGESAAINENGKVVIKKAGDTIFKLYFDGNEYCNPAYTYVTVTVKKGDLDIRMKAESKVYDGTPVKLDAGIVYKSDYPVEYSGKPRYTWYMKQGETYEQILSDPIEAGDYNVTGYAVEDDNFNESPLRTVYYHIHKLEKTEKVAATCVKDGTKAYWTCSVCKKMFSDEKGENEITEPEVIKSSGHSLTKTDEVAATCDKAGTKAYWTCSVCKKMFSDEKGENEITEPEVIKTTGHSLTKTDEDAASCEKDGTKAYWTCSDCNKLFSDEKGENEIAEPEVIKATGHDWGVWTELDADQHQRVCNKDSNHVETAEHKWDGGTVTQKATTSSDGVMTYTCADCGATKKEAIPAPDPKPEPEPEPAPKKTVSGTLLAKMTAKGGKTLILTWSKIDGADGYDIFFNSCKYKKFKKVKTIKGNEKFSWTKKSLKKKKPYKALVKAWVMENGKKTYVRTGLTSHAYTSGGTKNYTNAKSVKVKKTKISLKAGSKYKIKAKVKKLQKGKKLMPSVHAPKLRYVSSNTNIATVSKSGKVTAKAKGSCSIYVVAVNGARKTIRLTVN